LIEKEFLDDGSLTTTFSRLNGFLMDAAQQP